MTNRRMVKRKSASGSSPPDLRRNARLGITVVDAADALQLAAKAAPIEDRPEIDTSDIPETDFTQLEGVRGKYYARFLEARLAQLDPDVRAAFPDDSAVNRALRLVIELAKDLRT